MMIDKEDLWTGLGIMCVLLGIGGCSYLVDKGDAEKDKARQQVTIERQIHTETNKTKP